MSEVIITYVSIADKTASAKKQRLQFVEKVCFFKKVLVLNPYPQTPFPGKGAILLGLPPLDPVGGYAPATPFSENTKVYRQTEASAKKQRLT